MEALAKSAGPAVVILLLVLLSAPETARPADSSESPKRSALPEALTDIVSGQDAQFARKIEKALGKKKFAIAKAAIEDGKLVVAGVTERPRQRVRLDGRYTTQSGANRVFSFEKTYWPEGCEVKVTAGRANRRALVQYCGPEGPEGPTGPEGPMGPIGLRGPQGETGP